MDKIIQEIDSLLPKLQERIKYGRRQLKKLPKGYITSENRHGVQTPVWVETGSGKRKRVSISGKLNRYGNSDAAAGNKGVITMEKCIRSILMSQYVETCEYEYEILLGVKHTSEKIAKGMRRKKLPSMGKVIYGIKKDAPQVDENLIEAIYNEIFGTELTQAEIDWMNAPYEHFDGFEDTRGQLTSRGLKVRSKSELLIAEKLYENNIAFRYEQVIRNDEFMVVPDFTILRKDGKIFYWEHMGLTSSKQYLDRQLQKIRSYASIGITPWDNLILTFDNKNGELDLRIIDSEIQNKLQL